MNGRLPGGRFLVTWLRLLVLALSMHIGVLALAAVADADEPCTDDSGCCSDCPIERSGQECPPGCPNCHCHHAGGAAAIPDVKGEELSLPTHEQGDEKRDPPEATAPRQPPLPSIFRPPRSRSLLS
jgi:hypothetical protein